MNVSRAIRDEPMKEIWKGIRWTIGIAIGLGIIVGVIIAGRAIFEVVWPEDGSRNLKQGTLNTSDTVKMDATEAKLYIDSMVLPVSQCSGFSDLKRSYVQGLVEPCVFAGTATTVYSYPSTDETWLAWCSLDLPKVGIRNQDTYLQGECDRVLKHEKSPTHAPTLVPTPEPTPQVYIECMNIHDDYFTCRCFLDNSAPGCR